MNTRDTETIVAQCTPQGSGSIALIRVSGPDAFSITSRISILAGNKKLADLQTHTIHYGKVIGTNKSTIDNCMFLLMRSPKTFTGEDVVEITCHNNQFIINDIIQQAISHGARLAFNGEFSKRAFLNKKIDLIQAEAINELIQANNQLALRQSLEQLDGSFSHWLATIEKALLKALAYSEASFEFIDEEDLEFGKQIKNEVDTILTTITSIKKTFDIQQQIRDGVRIALVGSVNAGKSSLFNALIAQERAIVTNIPGTTRDVIEAGLYKNNSYWTLIDTAGLRTTDNTIEQEGIKRSFAQAEKADIVLIVYDQSRTITAEENTFYHDLLSKHPQKALIVKNKIDLPTAATLNTENTTIKIIETSTTEKKNIDKLEQEITNKIADLFEKAESPFLLNSRHYTLLCELEKKLHEILHLLDGTIEYEILSCHINDALQSITELTGKSISERGMDAIFKEFCVGK